MNDTTGGAPPDVTGLIGQYVHGNEPSHHVIYLFTLLGRPDLAARYVHEVFDRFYRPKPDGLCGNDDCGQMSAWYLFSAMGFYPVNPCGGEYVIGTPQVPKATLRLLNPTIQQSNNPTIKQFFFRSPHPPCDRLPRHGTRALRGAAVISNSRICCCQSQPVSFSRASPN